MADVFLILAVLVLLLLVGESITYWVSTYNGLVGLRNDIVKAWANIDVLLKQRHDEIPNLIASVKGYMDHEQGVLEGVAKARSTLEQANTVGEKEAADNIIRETLGKLYAVVENYPQLKADQSFLKLQTRITGIENQIADRREFYNDAATIYNTRIESIPERLIAKKAGFGRFPLFKATAEERSRIEVVFRGGP
jgi:LemA protein